MRPGKVIFLSALTVIGGTLIARRSKTVRKIPGFSANG